MVSKAEPELEIALLPVLALLLVGCASDEPSSSPQSGPTVAGSVTVTRGAPRGQLSAGFAGFSFEKTHITDGFFAPSHAPLIALFKLLGPSIVRIGANDVDKSSWVPAATPVPGDQTTLDIGTLDVDALADFLGATGWQALYGVSMKAATEASVDESVYVANKLGASLRGIEIGNEINYFADNAVGTPAMQWASFETAIHAASTSIPLAGPAAMSAVTNFTVPFANAEGTKIVLLTEHYYKGPASSTPTIAAMLAPDPSVAAESQALAAAVQDNQIRDGFRWGEVNSYSGHGAAGVSDVFAAALWGIDFMLTAAEYGATGVNFHGGGQNMDNNVCTNGVDSCTSPFRYSPILELDGRVIGAAPLYYGMLLVSRAGVGDLLPTEAAADSLDFTAYSVGLADSSTNIVLVNKDATRGVQASVDTGAPVSSASAVFLLAPSLDAKTGVTFSGAEISPTGEWTPMPPHALPTSGQRVSVTVPPASAVVVHASP